MNKQQDAAMMARALQLAAAAKPYTSPNPAVGCVLVQGGEIIAEGRTQPAGEAHAEVQALSSLTKAQLDAGGITAYVSLEPCSHTGKTGPCSEALVAAGIARVVCAMEDPNEAVAGRGISRLRAAGIEVDVGLMAGEAEAINPGFFRRMRGGLPRLRIKLAMSLDGRTAMANGESQWITGPEARADVQQLRAESCAIISGIDTVLADNAALTVRDADGEIAGRQPLRVVLDSRARLPKDAALLRAGGPVLHCVAESEQGLDDVSAVTYQCLPLKRLDASEDAEGIESKGIEGGLDLSALLAHLAEQQCNEVLVETGATLAGAVLAQGLADEMIVYMAPCLLGSEARPLLNLPLASMRDKHSVQIRDIRAVGPDWRIEVSV